MDWVGWRYRYVCPDCLGNDHDYCEDEDCECCGGWIE